MGGAEEPPTAPEPPCAALPWPLPLGAHQLVEEAPTPHLTHMDYQLTERWVMEGVLWKGGLGSQGAWGLGRGGVQRGEAGGAEARGGLQCPGMSGDPQASSCPPAQSKP